MSFPIFTTIPSDSNYGPFVDNWKRTGFTVTSINNADEAKDLRKRGLNVIEVESATRKLKIASIMRTIASSGAPVAGFINADCKFALPINLKSLSHHATGSMVLAERIDINANGIAVPVLSLGFDAFFFDTKALLAIPCDLEYSIGTPWWDYWFPFFFKESGFKLKKFSCPILLHTAHNLNWDEQAFLNGARALKSSFPDLHVYENNWPNAYPCFNELSASEIIDTPEIDAATSEIFKSVPELVRQIHVAQQERNVIRDEAEVLKGDIDSLKVQISNLNSRIEQQDGHLTSLMNSRSYRLAWPIRAASTVFRTIARSK